MLEICSEIVLPSERPIAYFAAAHEVKEKKLAQGQECPSVLVVDDEETVATTTVEILKMAGFCAFAAYDGHTALALARKFHPDILLTDVVMPGMNGVELAVAITSLLPHTRIQLISGQTGPVDLLEEARRHGHNFELVAKPIHPVKLIEHLRRLGDKSS